MSIEPIDLNNGVLMTERCIYCLEPANSWSGHVLMNDYKVIAGTCKQCEHGNCLSNKQGLYGVWKTEMGLVYDKYGV